MTRDELEAALALAAGADVRDGAVLPVSTAVGPVAPGWLDKRILLQEERWIDAAARTHRLEDMSVAYRTNVIAFLVGFEDEWAALALVYATAEALLGRIDAREVTDQHRLVALLRPGWMYETPLVRRLLDLNRDAAVPSDDEDNAR